MVAAKKSTEPKATPEPLADLVMSEENDTQERFNSPSFYFSTVYQKKKINGKWTEDRSLPQQIIIGVGSKVISSTIADVAKFSKFLREKAPTLDILLKKELEYAQDLSFNT